MPGTAAFNGKTGTLFKPFRLWHDGTGFFADNRRHRRVIDIPLLTGGRMVLGNRHFWPLALWFLFDCGVFFVFSVCSSAIVAIGFTITKELFPVEIAGTSVGTVNLFPFPGGAIYMPMLGKILHAYPHSAAGAYAIDGCRSMPCCW